MVHIRELTLAALLLTGPASALYSKSGPIQLLDPKSFDKEILHSDHAAIVEFFAPWCGHCQSLAPQYEKVGKNLRGIAKVAAVDCNEDGNKVLCGSHGIEGFPTLKIFKPTSKKGKPIVEDYQGPRTAKAIVDAIVERIPNHVTRLTSDKLNDWLVEKNSTTKAVLFTEKGTTSALYRALAIEFLGRALFAQIRNKEEEAVNTFGVKRYPTLIVLPGGEAPGKVYEGAMNIDSLKEFIKDIAPPKSRKVQKTEPKVEIKIEDEIKIEEIKEEDSNAEDTTPIPEPPLKAIPVILELADEASLSETCFGPKSKTCVLAIVAPYSGDVAEDPKLTGLNGVNEQVSRTTGTFKFYRVSSESVHGKALVETLSLSNENPSVIAVNGHRRWYRVFSGLTDTPSLLAWLDGIAMGDVKKQKLPKGFLQPSVEEEEEPKLLKAEPVVEEESKPVVETEEDHDEL